MLAIILCIFVVCTYVFVIKGNVLKNFVTITENLKSIKLPFGNEQNKQVHEEVNHEADRDNEKLGLVSEPANVENNVETIEALKGDLEKYISGFEGIYGIFYMDLNSEEQFGINETEEYIAASTVKVPLNLYLYTRIYDGYVRRDGLLEYLKQDYEEGTGELQYTKFGKRYTIAELSRLSLVKSDNVATNMLFRYLGKQRVKNFMVQSGGMVVSKDENISCPKDMGQYMKLVYDFYKKDDVLGKELMDNLIKTEFYDRLPALLPKDVPIAHKTGNQVHALHDVGIIFTENPYILCVMSKDVNENEACDVIARISQKVYNYQTSLE